MSHTFPSVLQTFLPSPYLIISFQAARNYGTSFCADTQRVGLISPYFALTQPGFPNRSSRPIPPVPEHIITTGTLPKYATPRG
jgi:hypothetical protein